MTGHLAVRRAALLTARNRADLLRLCPDPGDGQCALQLDDHIIYRWDKVADDWVVEAALTGGGDGLFDTIDEFTLDHGVVVDGVLLKDDNVTAVDGTFSGGLTADTLGLTGLLSGAQATFTGLLTAASLAITGPNVSLHGVAYQFPATQAVGVLHDNGAGVLTWSPVDWSELTSVPATFPPSPHTHPASDITPGTFATGGTFTFPEALTVDGVLTGVTSLVVPVIDTGAAVDLLVKRNGVTQLTVGAGAAVFVGTVAGTQFLGAVVDSNAATDLLLKRDGTTILTLGSAVSTFAGGLTVTGATLLNGAVTLGDATGDDLTPTGRWAGSLVPKTANTYDIGDATLTWKNGYYQGVVYTGALASLQTSDPLPSATTPINLRSYGRTIYEYRTDSTAEYDGAGFHLVRRSAAGGAASVNWVVGEITFSGGYGSAASTLVNAIIFGQARETFTTYGTHGATDLVFGAKASGSGSANAQPTVRLLAEGHWVPHTDNVKDLGADSTTGGGTTRRWRSLRLGTDLRTDAGTGGSGIVHHYIRMTDGTLQWGVGLINTGGGSNVGADYAIWRYSDSGVLLGNWLTVTRSSGAWTITGNGNVTGTLTASSTVQGTQLISTVATGTAPLTVTSTTKVTNLDAHYLGASGQDDAFFRNASNLNAGTIASARVSGAYSGITGVGTLASGAVPASLVTAGTFGAGDYVFPANLTGLVGYFGTTPSDIAPYFVAGDSGFALTRFHVVRVANPGNISLGRIDGSLASPTAIATGQTIGAFSFRAWDGGAYSQAAQVQALTTEAWTTTARGSRLNFGTTTIGTTTNLTRAWLDENGWYPGSTNSYDIGTSALVWRTGRFGTSVISPIVDSGSATDLLLKRNAVTQLTLGSSLATFVGAVTTGGNLTVITTPTQGGANGAFTAGAFGGGSLVWQYASTDAVRWQVDGASASQQMDTYGNTAGFLSAFLLRRARGTLASPTDVTAGDSIGALRFVMLANGAFAEAARVSAEVPAGSTVSSTSKPATIFFSTVANGATTLTKRWQVMDSGHFIAFADNAYDIGASGATRPRNIYVGTSVDAATSYKVAGTQVVGARVTGYTAMTGSPDKATAYATGTVTLAQLAGRVAQLQADLTAHGLIGA